jgi:hypothetical protein
MGRTRLEETERDLLALREELDPSVDLFVGGGAASLLDASTFPKGVRVHDGLDALPAPPWIATGRSPSR